MKVLDIYITPSDHFGAVVKKAIAVSATYLKLRFSDNKNTTEKVVGIDFQHAISGIEYQDLEHMLSGAVYQVECRDDDLYIRHGWNWNTHLRLTAFPHYFCLTKGEIETDMDVDEEYFAPAPETPEEFKARLMPYLYEAAKAFSHQVHHNMPHFTGNARKILQTVRDKKSNDRFESSVNAFRLPIGFAVGEIEKSTQGKSELTRLDIEALVKDIHEVFTQDGFWWEFYRTHNDAHWNKHHNERKILLHRLDGTVDLLCDIDKTTIKNLDPENKSNQKLIDQKSEDEFKKIATKFYTESIFTDYTEYVTARKLTFQKKRNVMPTNSQK